MGGILVDGMRKKIDVMKKKNVQAPGWATAHFALGHDTVHCIVTQGAQQARMDRQQGPRYGRDRPRYDRDRPRYGRLACKAIGARARV